MIGGGSPERTQLRRPLGVARAPRDSERGQGTAVLSARLAVLSARLSPRCFAVSPPAGLSLGWRLTFWICSVHVNAGARFLPWACSLGGRSRRQSDQTRHTGAQVLPPRASARSRVAALAWPGGTGRPRLGPPWLRAWSGGSSPCGWRQLISGSFLFLFLFFTTLGGSEFYLEDDGKLSFPHKSVSATATRSPPHAHAARGSARAGLCAGPSRSPFLAPCYVL